MVNVVWSWLGEPEEDDPVEEGDEEGKRRSRSNEDTDSVSESES